MRRRTRALNHESWLRRVSDVSLTRPSIFSRNRELARLSADLRRPFSPPPPFAPYSVMQMPRDAIKWDKTGFRLPRVPARIKKSSVKLYVRPVLKFSLVRSANPNLCAIFPGRRIRQNQLRNNNDSGTWRRSGTRRR